MKIHNFKIENFKSFKDTNNKLKLANNINFIYGANNSGKSNVLKFLEIIFKPKTNHEIISVEGKEIVREEVGDFYDGIINNEPFIYHKNNRGQNILFEFDIIVTKLELQESGYIHYQLLNNEYFTHVRDFIKIKIQGKIESIDSKSTSYIELSRVLIDDTEAYLNDGGSSKVYFKDKPTLEGNKIAFNDLISYFNNCILYIDNNRYFDNETYQNIEVELKPSNYKNWLYNYSLDNYKHEEYESLLAFIRSFQVGQLNDISNLDLSFSIDSDNNLELMLNKGTERLPITSFGTGINQILYILTNLFITKSKILIIEELELNLSPNSQKELFKIFKKLIDGKYIDQVFFTSHSSFFNFRNDFSIYEITIDKHRISSINKKEKVSKSFFQNRLID